jgi:hypothetical protein
MSADLQQRVHHEFIARLHFRNQNRPQISTRSSQKKGERALLKQESTLVPHMRMNSPRETLSKGISMSFAAFGS